MLYQMYAKGYVQSLDDPLRKYAPDFKINSINAKYENFVMRIIITITVMR